MGPSVLSTATKTEAVVRPALALMPALAAACYPLWLRAAHAVAGPLAALPLLAALAMPLLAFTAWMREARRPAGSAFERRAGRLALLACAAPPLFVWISFLLGVLGRPLHELVAWVGAWAIAAAWVWRGDPAGRARPGPAPDATARIVHGLLAALLLAFVVFHLANHLAGLLGPQAHAALMQAGRRLYRMPAVEAMLVVLLLLQLALGAWLAWRWSAKGMDGYRAVQVATGVYVGFFLLTHMNSALVSARLMHGWETDWAWASAAPVGLLRDAWSIRLLPHYALGVFCVLAHLACGLRVVLLAHGRRPGMARRIWWAGLIFAAAVAAAIVAGLCGLRIGAGATLQGA